MVEGNTKTIAKNTVLLYVRMVLSVLVGLYTSRVVLRTLGVDDYGIYSVVGGVVGMFSFLNAAMSGATSRFLTFEMGKGDFKKLQETFSTTLIIHIGIALAVLVLAETVGLWFLCHKLVLPEGRMAAAHVVYQCSVLGAMVTITQVPYSAVIIAHEKMDVYAYVELANVFMKLGVVFLLLLIAWDKLIVYSVLIFAVSVVIAMTYRVYCIRHYLESHFRWMWDKTIFKPMLNFSGWNLFSECGYAFRVHGSNIALNMFFGTIVNAAGGIASTVQGILLGFVANIVTAVRPQIIKNYSQGNLERMNTLIKSSIRLNLLLVSLVTIPVFVDAPYLLNLWLDEVPQYSVEFCQLLLFAIYITSVSQIVTIGIHATGDIRLTSIVRNVFYISTPFVIYLVLKFFPASPVLGYAIIVLNQMIVCITDIFILHRNIPYIKSWGIFWDYCKAVTIFVLIVFVMHFAKRGETATFLYFVFNCVLECGLSTAMFVGVIFGKKERQLLADIIHKTISKFKR